MTKTVQKILRLRQFALLEAKRELAAAMGRADKAETRLDATQCALTSETSATVLMPIENIGVPWASWLPIGQRDLQQAAAEVKRADADKSRAQEQLATCRAHVRAAELLAESEAGRERRCDARKSQHQLEDASRRRG